MNEEKHKKSDELRSKIELLKKRLECINYMSSQTDKHNLENAIKTRSQSLKCEPSTVRIALQIEKEKVCSELAELQKQYEEL